MKPFISGESKGKATIFTWEETIRQRKEWGEKWVRSEQEVCKNGDQKEKEE